jgi:hypothetical protein
MAQFIVNDRRERGRRANPVCRACRRDLEMIPLRRDRYSVAFKCPLCGFTRSLATLKKAARSTNG